MKKAIYAVAVLFMTGLMVGCEKEKTETNTEIQSSPTEEATHSDNEEEKETESKDAMEAAKPDNEEEKEVELGDAIEIDFTYDYTEDIKADVSYVVSVSSSLQEELENIDKITQKYTLLSEAALTQGEMNVASQWLYMVWDTELNNLWKRFSNSADPDRKEKVLEEQRNWIAMKEEVTLLGLGTPEENGSMYSMLVNAFWEEKTKNRAYFIASELAKVNGEVFTMPEESTKYGLFVDNQGSGEVYSSLITKQSWDGEDEAIISIYRQGMIEGNFIDNGNGELAFTSDDGSIKGIIEIGGWDGATFEVTETTGVSTFAVGEKMEFPFAF